MIAGEPKDPTECFTRRMTGKLNPETRDEQAVRTRDDGGGYQPPNSMPQKLQRRLVTQSMWHAVAGPLETQNTNGTRSDLYSKRTMPRRQAPNRGQIGTGSLARKLA